jgi:hypothetical protein
LTVSLREWIVKRGVLYVLAQTPMIAMLLGFYWRVLTLPVAFLVTVVPAFVLLPAWVALRKNRSTDPAEPVHHLHKYALYALAPYVVYGLAREAGYYLVHVPFWSTWYSFGNTLTGQPVNQYPSLISGTILHSLQGYVLALGFYILYRRHSLFNALIYVWIFLSTIYSWIYPLFFVAPYPVKFYFFAWWAHFWMAITAWYVPRKLYNPALWSHLRTSSAKAAAASLIVVLYVFPFAWVYWQAATWQFPTQHLIDQTAFARAKMTLQNGPALIQQRQEAHYQFVLRLGSRSYTDYTGLARDLDIGPITVTGHLLRHGTIVAWCSTYIPSLESPNRITKPALYLPAVRKMNYSDFTADCLGPPRTTTALRKGDTVELHWTANANLIADRESQLHAFSGTG